MTRGIPAIVAMFAAAVITTACSNGSSTPATSPTAATVPQPTTQAFTGSLTPNGADTFPFAAQAGTMTATLTSLGSGATLAVGLSLGVWDGTACTIGVANDAAQISTVVTGNPGAAGNYCVRVYDVGNVTSALPFTVTVVHQ